VGAGEYRTTVAIDSPAEDGAARATFLRWTWYAARRDGLRLDEADDDYSTNERVDDALRTVVAPALRLSTEEQRALRSSARLVRYGADEVVESVGQVPDGMTFLVAGRVQLTAIAADGTIVPVSTLEKGSFLGLTALTRQPNLATAYALEEVVALVIDRGHLEHLVTREPLLLRSFGHILDERRGKVRQVAAHERVG
jgi:CRP-like cAMP-binding protein